MATSNLSVGLLTPASDIVTAADGVDFNLVFGRGGNDLFYTYDPIADANVGTKIDILFGDIFDNTPDEFNVILNIAAGNPLAILDANIPSVGRDRFVFGDALQPFYTSPDPLSLLTTNLFGFNEFAVIYDFDPNQDTIQLNGKKTDYSLIKVDNLPLQGAGNFSGYALFSLQAGAPDLVSLILEKPSVTLKLDQSAFQYVGSKPKTKPQDKKIGQFGTTGLDLGYGVATDQAGNLYVTGSTSGSLFGANQGSSDVWLAKYDVNGNQSWGRQLGSADGEEPYRVVTDKTGNFYLAGTTSGSFVAGKQSADGTDAWVAKYDSNGNFQWGKQVGEPITGGFSTSGFGLQVDDGGNVYLSGLTIKENPPPRFLDFDVQDDSWVIKFDGNGNQQWFTQIKDPQAPFPLNQTPFFDESYALALDKNGNTYSVGWTQGLVKESDPSRNLLKYDAWLSKVDTNGNIQWTQQFGSTDQGIDFAWGVDTDSQGNIYVSGWTTGKVGAQNFGSYDVWLTKFTPTGRQVWAKQVGTQGDDGEFFPDVVIDANDNIFVSGYTNDNLGTGSSDKSYNAWVGKFDTNGNNQWLQKFGVKDRYDNATRLAVNNAGQLFVTGYTEGVLGSGSNPGFQPGAVDAWVAQLATSNGKLQKFIGSDDVISIDNPGSVATIDISGKLVTADKLPNGDNRITATQGSNTGINVVDYGQIAASLTPVFDPKVSTSVTSALAKTLGNSFSSNSKVDYKGTDSDNVYVGSSVDDSLSGNKGNDVLYGLAGNDTLAGDEGDDLLYGGTGNDQVKGGKGNDVIYGVDFKNTQAAAVKGFGEIDTLQGDDGADVFGLGDENQAYYIGKGNGDYALINDFKANQFDKIQLNGSAGNYSLRTNVSGLPKGTGIFRNNDLIGVVKDVQGLALNNTNVFSYV